MTTVGLRQLRQNASAYLRRVEAGETIQITDRGRVVALWVPIPDAHGLRRLDAQRRLSDAQGDVLDLGPPLGPPLAPSPHAPRVSHVLSEAREHER